MSDSPESCGLCWRGPGSNSACAEHHEQYVERLEADWDRVNERMVDAEREAEQLGAIVRALAANGPYQLAAVDPDGEHICTFCAEDKHDPHAESCPWRLARELIGDSDDE